jgi:hypothetical protein
MTSEGKEKVMLNILADALLIALRMGQGTTTPNRHQHQEPMQRRKPADQRA